MNQDLDFKKSLGNEKTVNEDLILEKAGRSEANSTDKDIQHSEELKFDENYIDPDADKPKGYLLLHNVSKGKNVGMLVRSACAFKMRKIFTIAKNESKKEMKIGKLKKHYNFFGSHGTFKEIDFQNFNTLEEAKVFFVENKITVCGVEITKDSESVVKHPFRGDTVFFMGNEGTGILDVHKKICDQFIYIPQYTNKTASLNVAVAGSIIFHHFALWAGYDEGVVYGEKFQEKNVKLNEPSEGVHLATQPGEGRNNEEVDKVRNKKQEGRINKYTGASKELLNYTLEIGV